MFNPVFEVESLPESPKKNQLKGLLKAMAMCQQNESQSVLEHGMSVNKWYNMLMERAWGKDQARIPNWFTENYRKLIKLQHEQPIVEMYHVFHDCGKPYCRMVDEGGRVHFPDHANFSYSLFVGMIGEPTVARLIRYDMAYHTLAQTELNSLDLSEKDRATLLVTALAEIHSNAEMFGGIDSDSFKMKWKKIERRGRHFCKNQLN